MSFTRESGHFEAFQDISRRFRKFRRGYRELLKHIMTFQCVSGWVRMFYRLSVMLLGVARAFQALSEGLQDIQDWTGRSDYLKAWLYEWNTKCLIGISMHSCRTSVGSMSLLWGSAKSKQPPTTQSGALSSTLNRFLTHIFCKIVWLPRSNSLIIIVLSIIIHAYERLLTILLTDTHTFTTLSLIDSLISKHINSLTDSRKFTNSSIYSLIHSPVQLVATQSQANISTHHITL